MLDQLQSMWTALEPRQVEFTGDLCHRIFDLALVGARARRHPAAGLSRTRLSVQNTPIANKMAFGIYYDMMRVECTRGSRLSCTETPR